MPATRSGLRRTWAAGRGALVGGMAAWSCAWPQFVAAQDAAGSTLPVLVDCAGTYSPQIAGISQAAALARKNAGTVIGLRVRQVEMQVSVLSASLLTVQNAADCQKVAAQVDTLRERLERLVPGALQASATAAAPTAGAAPLAAQPAQALSAAPDVAPNDTRAQPDAWRPAAASPPVTGAQGAQGQDLLACQASNRRELAALERDVNARQAARRLTPAEQAAQNRELEGVRNMVNLSLAPQSCQETATRLSFIRTQFAAAGQATAAPSPPVAMPAAAASAPTHAATVQAAPSAHPQPGPAAGAVHAPAPHAAPPVVAVAKPPPPPPPAAKPAPPKADDCAKDKGKNAKKDCKH